MLSNIINLFNKTQEKNDHYFVDIHSHLIPGIDDGVKTLDESISLIKEMQNLGFEKLITTPHIMKHRFPNTSDTIKRGFEEVQEEIIKQNINIELEYASEYFFDEHFMELIRKKDILSFGDNYVLFELPYSAHKNVPPPIGLENTIFELQSAGYRPVLAHPERYNYYANKLDKLLKYKDQALLFQMNVNSFGGFYGKTAQKTAQTLLKEGLVDFVGSDLHNYKYVDCFQKTIHSKNFNQGFRNNRIKNSFL